MDNFLTSEDPLDLEIAAKDAEIAKAQSGIAEAEAQIAKLKQDLELMSIEVRALKRAASLRPAMGTAAAAPRQAPPPQQQPQPQPMQSMQDPLVPPASAGRFRDVVDQIRANR
jgi:peptidoglycan hydrolase CwlO-like protein